MYVMYVMCAQLLQFDWKIENGEVMTIDDFKEINTFFKQNRV